jgi:hypothetical protein
MEEPRKDRILEEAVSRAVRDNLAPLQVTAEVLQQAFADLVAACASTKPSNALPAMLRAQTAAASLAASLSVLSNFITAALQPRERPAAEAALLQSVEAQTETGAAPPSPAPIAAAGPALAPSPAHVPPEIDVEPEAEGETEHIVSDFDASPPEPVFGEPLPDPVQAASGNGTSATGIDTLPAVWESAEEAVDEETLEPPAESPAFDVSRLSTEEQGLHRRANRVAKVAMQDIQLLRPEEVRQGRAQKDLCTRLRPEMDKARKEYDRRFKTILDHPVDYFHDWMVEILAEGDPEALGEYPYPSPVLRH